MGLFDDAMEQVQNVGKKVGQAVGGGKNVDILTNIGGGFSPMSPFNIGNQLYQSGEAVDRAKEAEEQARQREAVSQGILEQQRQKQKQFANQLKENAARDKGLLMDTAAGNERRALASRLADVKQSASSRGLLGSGIQKFQEAGETAKSKASLAEKQSQIEELSRQQIQDAEDLSTQLGLQAAGYQANQADKYYSLALQNLNNRNQAFKDLTSAGGAVAGTLLARNRYNQPQQSQQYGDSGGYSPGYEYPKPNTGAY